MTNSYKCYGNEGWPTQRSTPPDIQPYRQMRNEIHCENGLMFAGDKLIVPVAFRKEILDKLHESHLGMEKCKSRARESLYWPNMCKDIENTVASCETCATYQRQNQKEPLIPHPVPERPWSKLGADIFEFEGRSYLLIVDYYSKYPEVARLENKTATGVIKVMKPILARHGIPDVLMSDNMPFSSYKMKEFAQDWSFDLITSSPTYPQSNGQSERFVGTVKALFRKAKHEGKDPNIALLEYRNTPITGLKFSPAQLLMNRRLKDKIPMSANLLKPAIISDSREMLQQRQHRQKYFYDRGSRKNRNYHVGDNVRLHRGKVWDAAIITGQHDTPKSFYVTTSDGETYRRNQRFLNPWSKPVQIMPHSDDTYTQTDKSETSQAVTLKPKLSKFVSPPDVPQEPQQPISPRRSGRTRVPPVWLQEYDT